MQAIGSFLAAYWLPLVIIAVVSYLLGSISFAIIVTKAFTKTDIRSYGSGNAGATNVLRSQGKLPAILTTVGDLAKSCGAALLGWWILHLATGNDATTLPPEQLRLIGMYLAGVCCMLGHMYPIFFGFRGGKGVLTTLGMMLILDWRGALLCLGGVLGGGVCSRMVSLGSICAAVALVILTGVFRTAVDGYSAHTAVFCTVMAAGIAALLFLKHIPNIKRILNGTESKLSFGKKEK